MFFLYTAKIEGIGSESRDVGGKAKNLGEMVKAGLPVPPGFVVTTEAYVKFMKANKLPERIGEILGNLDVDDVQALQDGSREIKELILNSQIPDYIEKPIKESYEDLSIGKEAKEVGGVALDMIKAGRDRVLVAVRSSASAEDLPGASFAGQMKSILNVSGIGAVLSAVKECWASLFTPRAIFYRKNKGFNKIPKMGVIVQKMIESEKSGVMFTADPATNDTTKVLIEGSWGLGEAVVAGLVTPDEYEMDKTTGEVLMERVHNKLWMIRRDPSTGKTVKESVPREKQKQGVLSGDEINKLWELARKVEDHYKGQPQDIEWCIERGRIYLVQTRPITTLGEGVSEASTEEAGDIIIEGLSASPGIVKGKVRIIAGPEEIGKIEEGDIMVTKTTNPDYVPIMRKAKAIITDSGGRTSHAAIVSRELGIPCIVGAEDATTKLKDGQEVTVDATSGKVYEGLRDIGKEQAEVSMPGGPEIPSSALDKFTATEIKVNLAFPEMAKKAVDKCDGVGLLRAEHMLTESGKHPIYLSRENPEELIGIIKKSLREIARVFHPKPVWYRTLDARTDEFRSLEGGEEEPQEDNPMLGWHGIRRSLDEPDVFKCELEAIKRLRGEGLDNILVMLPFVSSVEEVRAAKEIISSVFQGEGLGVGIMVETPAAALVVEELCKEGIDFISIGSNDLTQLVLGVDRNNANISKLYSEFHPAVVKLIRDVVKTCKGFGVKSSICGEAGSDPRMAEILVEVGIDSISSELDSLDKIKLTVARTERKLLLDRVRGREDL